MSLQTTSNEDLQQVSMLELADRVLLEEGKAIHFKDIFAKIEEIKNYSDEEIVDRLAQFYTDLNLDGRFLTVGDNLWGLKRWYPVEQIDAVVHTEPTKKKKTTKKKAAKKKTKPKEAEPEIEDDIDKLTRDLAQDDEEDEDILKPDDQDLEEAEDEEEVEELGEDDYSDGDEEEEEPEK